MKSNDTTPTSPVVVTGGNNFTRLQITLLVTTSIVSSIIVPLIVPTIKESVLSLFYESTFIDGYMGDGILIGDAETNLPFSTVNWVISQDPTFTNSYHTVTIYVVPADKAKEYIYPFRRHFTSEVYRVRDEAETQSIGMRSYIYLLPKKYLKHTHEAKVQYYVNISDGYGNERLGSTVYWYQNVDSFSDFIDHEPGAQGHASGCSCLYGGAVKKICREDDQKCQQSVKNDVGCPEICSNNDPYFEAENSSYNFFAIAAPSGSLVQYNISIDMFFYDHIKLEKYRMCTILGKDVCSFQTPGFTLFPEKRDLIIGFIHPTSIPTFFTTRLSISSEVHLDFSKSLLLMIVLVVIAIIKHCFQGIYT